MSLAIDAILLFTAVFILWAGTSRGFIRSVMGLFSTLASLFAAYAYTPVLAAHIKEHYLMKRIADGINETLRSLAFDTSTDLYNLDRLAEDLPDPFTGILSRYGVDIEAFAEKLRGLTGCGEHTVYGFAEEIAEPTSALLASALAFLAIFLGVFIVLGILTALINLIFKIPVLKTANMVLGFLFGAAEAAAVAIILAMLMSVLVTALGSIEPTLFGADVVEDTMICSRILKFDIVKKLMSVFA